MKKIIIFLLLAVSIKAIAQPDMVKKYYQADSLDLADDVSGAYRILKEIEPVCSHDDTIYAYILWRYIGVTTSLEKQNRMQEKFDQSLVYGLEALTLIEKGKNFFSGEFAAREHWMRKNVIGSYFGLGQLDNAKKQRDILYAAYRDKRLTKGIDEYFNFSFFKWQDKNVWGYEWFEELPEDRMSKSFSKVVYYVYSTKADGSDNEQLYRLHVLMFHKIDPKVEFDYVLTKRLETATNEKSGTLYAYTYKKDIDYKKLELDIREVLKGNYEPGASSTIKKD